MKIRQKQQRLAIKAQRGGEKYLCHLFAGMAGMKKLHLSNSLSPPSATIPFSPMVSFSRLHALLTSHPHPFLSLAHCTFCTTACHAPCFHLLFSLSPSLTWRQGRDRGGLGHLFLQRWEKVVVGRQAGGGGGWGRMGAGTCSLRHWRLHASHVCVLCDSKQLYFQENFPFSINFPINISACNALKTL